MDYKLYHYDPSIAAASVAVALFFLSTTFHTFQLLKNRTWYFIPFVVGGFFEWIGYIGRILNGREADGQWTLGPYIFQSLLLLLAPTLLAASVYMVLGRIIRLVDGEKYSLIPTKWLTKVFVLGDFFSFMTQSSGGGLLATVETQSDIVLAQWIITGGLLLQVLFFGMFIVVTALFHLRMVRNAEKIAEPTNIPWQRYLGVLYAVSSLIMVRCIFRVVEYVQGADGYLVSHEVFLYFFDALLMFLAMVLFNFWHPSKIIGRGRPTITEQQDPRAMENGTDSETFEK